MRAFALLYHRFLVSVDKYNSGMAFCNFHREEKAERTKLNLFFLFTLRFFPYFAYADLYDFFAGTPIIGGRSSVASLCCVCEPAFLEQSAMYRSRRSRKKKARLRNADAQETCLAKQ